MADLEKVVEKYIALRDLKATKKGDYEADVAEITAAMDKCEAFMMAEMRKLNITSVATTAGTAYTSNRTSATVDDWDSTLAFIRDNEQWAMLEKRVSKSAVEQYVEANKDLPPGVNWRVETTVNIRRK